MANWKRWSSRWGQLAVVVMMMHSGAPHALFGTYTVPSGATLTWPCSPKHWDELNIGEPAP